MASTRRAVRILLVAALALLRASVALADCGNGVAEPGELCEDGNVTAGDGCAADCTLESCTNPYHDGRWITGEVAGLPVYYLLLEGGGGTLFGSAVVQLGGGSEIPFGPISGSYDGAAVTLSHSLAPPLNQMPQGSFLRGACDTLIPAAGNPWPTPLTRGRCGNGVVEAALAEQCDDGAPCCVSCRLASAGTVCRSPVAPCDAEEICDGSTTACPADVGAVAPAGTICRPALECDVAETCDGISLGCPGDVVLPAGALCRAAEGVCDVEDYCDGVSPACGDTRATGTCRPAADVCDVAEACQGDVDCPPDEIAPAGTPCRAAATACDPVETCTGSTPLCPSDATESDGDADGVCDLLDNCVSVDNPAQADRDADGLGDSCDNAPAGAYTIEEIAADVSTEGALEEVGISAAGVVALTVPNVEGDRRPMSWDDGVLTDLGTPPEYPVGTTYGMNSAGDVLGFLGKRSVLWTSTGMVDLEPLIGAGSFAETFNATGEVAGRAQSGEAQVWSSAGAVALPLLPGFSRVRPIRMNDDGTIAGQAFEEGPFGPPPHPVRWVRDGAGWSIADLMPPDVPHASAFGMNSLGDIVGSVGVPPGPLMSKPFRWHFDGTVASLDLPPGQIYAEAYAVNASRETVGRSEDVDSVERAFLFDDLGPRDLSQLIPPDSGTTVTAAVAINDAGLIVALGRRPSDREEHGSSFRRAYLLTPVCGNGQIDLPADHCDDGNRVGGDDCDGHCRVTERQFDGAGTVSTGTAATAAVPVQATVEDAGGGDVTIVRVHNEDGETGYAVVGTAYEITADPAPPEDPLRFEFLVEPTAVPGGVSPESVEVFRNGAIVPACVGGGVVVDPLPSCVSARSLSPAGDGVITVITTAASVWTFGVPECPPVPLEGCKLPTAPRKSSLVLTLGSSDARDVAKWRWTAGAATTVTELGDPTDSTAYRFCVYDAADGVSAPALRLALDAGGTCGTKPCWKRSATGFTLSRSLSRGGVVKLALGSGVGGRAKMKLAGKGKGLGLPTLPLAQDEVVIAQLSNGLGECWEAQFSGAKRNDPGAFIATSD